MLAGIHDPRAGGDAAAKRLDAALGPRVGEPALAIGATALLGGAIHGRSAAAAGCVLEGSVYNLADLGAELGLDPALGAQTVLARGFERWGERLLDRLRGGFALVAWADGGRRLLVAQDQVGIGAIFLHGSSDRISFAAEVRDLLPLLARTPDPDESAVVAMLAMSDLEHGRTPFAGVRRLGAGCRLAITDGRVDERRYWRPGFQPPRREARLDSAARLRDGVAQAVALRIRPAEPVGIMLSGGLDSSVVAAAAVAVTDPPAVRGYSGVFSVDSGADDERLLDALCGALPLTNVRYRVEPGGALALSLAYLQHWKLPLAGPGLVTEHALLERAAADGVGVVLDGQGGDELFGAAPYLVADRLRAGRVAAAISLVQRFPGAGSGVGWRSVARVLRRYGLSAALPPRLHAAVRGLRSTGRPTHPFLTEGAARTLEDASRELGWIDGSGAPRWWQHLRNLLVDQREAAGLGDYVRHRAAWTGLEARPPLFDVELIELILRTRPELAFDPYFDRPLVREAVAGMLPDAVRLSRQKSNLGPFYFRGLTGPDLPLVREILGDEPEIRRWVRPGAIRATLDRPPALGGGDWDHWLSSVWGWLKVECWLRSLSDPAFAERFLCERRPAKPHVTEVGAGASKGLMRV